MERRRAARGGGAGALPAAAVVLLFCMIGSTATAAAASIVSTGRHDRRGPPAGFLLHPNPTTARAAAAVAVGPGPLQAVLQAQYEEVDKRNFHGVLERIREIGKEATFWSIDTEFTGAFFFSFLLFFDFVRMKAPPVEPTGGGTD